jgi:glucose/arabinose dehydrogenase
MKQVMWLCLVICAGQVFATTIPPSKATMSQSKYTTKELVTNLNSPWALKVDKNGRFWVTEKLGTLVIVEADLQQQRLDLQLPDLYPAGQGGLLDIILLDPPKLTNQTEPYRKIHNQNTDISEYQSIILSYAKGTAQANALTIAKLDLVKTSKYEESGQWQVAEYSEIFQISPKKSSPVHYAGRMLLLPDNTLLVNSGDGFDWREDAQRLTSLLGKTLRMTLSGAIPSDNPFSEEEDIAQRYVYSYGHRNAQGLTLGPGGTVWQHEHGPAGGDEINILAPRVNYGWPVITYGKDYSGAQISPFTEYADMRQPEVQWTPSIAPSAMLYQGPTDRYPELANSLLVTSLKYRRLHSVKLPASNLGFRHYNDIIIDMNVSERIRDISHHTEGDILLLTDGENAKIMQLLPVR